MNRETRNNMATRRFALQREINRYKVEKDHTVFRKTEEEKTKLKRLKKQYKASLNEV